jgi:Flp pilus assembly protein TadB
VSAAPARRDDRVAAPARSRRSSRTATRSVTGTSATAAARTRATERRRRERHYRWRRRDLLQDSGLALAITIVLIAETAGLGVLALLIVALAGGLIGSTVAGRVRRRRGRSRPGRSLRPRPR